MVYTYKVKETYETYISVEAGDEGEAMLALDRIQEEGSHVIDHWLEKGFQGRYYELVKESPDEGQEVDIRAEVVLG